jgi:anaerobic dimethyl sulfoxide reductase subunit B (iron-sulfur subunit)
MNKRLGISFDANRCVQCHACEVACKSANDVELGLKWRRVLCVWGGEYPNVTNRSLSLACMHCGNAPCISACPSHAISKRPEDGIVLVDGEKCIGCHTCFDVCPFGVPQYGGDGRMQKCHMCVDRIDRGLEPACVSTCPSEALHFGTWEELSELAATLAAGRLIGGMF